MFLLKSINSPSHFGSTYATEAACLAGDKTQLYESFTFKSGCFPNGNGSGSNKYISQGGGV